MQVMLHAVAVVARLCVSSRTVAWRGTVARKRKFAATQRNEVVWCDVRCPTRWRWQWQQRRGRYQQGHRWRYLSMREERMPQSLHKTLWWSPMQAMDFNRLTSGLGPLGHETALVFIFPLVQKYCKKLYVTRIFGIVVRHQARRFFGEKSDPCLLLLRDPLRKNNELTLLHCEILAWEDKLDAMRNHFIGTYVQEKYCYWRIEDKHFDWVRHASYPPPPPPPQSPCIE